ncbi:MAG: ABC transporter ATP-binding protein [Flavobacteriales bacterium]|jgi:ABC-type multidrug transport system ATPase subunit|nr:ABC transporter ATP-binding protein [Flavobacteriales bacterium]MBK6549715.1 ABC transporter ATP-binding protein [Flavobacteriales bacterium]MBK6883599.1 ABC transporter ATP-binding protein [Flavobacteriales bacterium]MBK7102231.1 ABC transporter ATP-binding protein [Flavobacteriales bacterium]MBK8533352.1 ABC transporter ATP-binding protein [Flavobacteriales bacterium]
MKIILTNLAKHFGREVVFQNVDLTLAAGNRTAILGPNGSGKSTLLQVIGGAIIPTKGTIEHRLNGEVVPQEDVYRHVAIASPYLGLYEELSLAQIIEFHRGFKPLRAGLGVQDVARIAYLEQALEKPVQHFSSGMKQRLKLALAILSDTPLLLLDEPASNLDADAIAWYRELLGKHLDGRTLLVASNRQAAEHDFCTAQVEVGNYKA